ncbi:hypothetical protein OpiT1DRAFT_03988 [Opitutaceae bacterium TAV1]|nr:hypothetical protein OpiT1DRAFT_03988 [Opitutaceae bacterium TAV1]
MSKVTEVIAIHQASGLTVCRGGDRVAVSAATPAGLVRLIVPLALWTGVARASRDSNGNPWPEDAPADPEARLAALCGVPAGQPAAAPAPPLPAPAPPRRERRDHAATTAIVRAIAAEIAAGSPETIAVLCGRRGISPNVYFSRTLELGIDRPLTRIQQKRAAVRAACLALERDIEGGSCEPLAQLAARHGISMRTVRSNIAALGGIRAMRAKAVARGPVLKPSGVIL